MSVAAELVDREGVKALSARRLAAELQCEAMSLYYYVGNMKELVNEVVDHALGAIPLPVPGSAPPRKLLVRMARAYLKVSEARPHTFQVVSSRRWRTPAELTYLARMVEIFIDAGFTAREALRGARMLVVYINGAGLALVGWKLDRGKPVAETPIGAMKEVLRFSNLTALRRDLESGIELLLDAILAGR